MKNEEEEEEIFLVILNTSSSTTYKCYIHTYISLYKYIYNFNCYNKMCKYCLFLKKKREKKSKYKFKLIF